MASNFRVHSHRNKHSLSLKPIGDFDGSSAFELLNALNDNVHGVRRVIINTSNLGMIHPFGLRVFESHFRDRSRSAFEIVFTGEKAKLFSPGKSYPYCG